MKWELKGTTLTVIAETGDKWKGSTTARGKRGLPHNDQDMRAGGPTEKTLESPTTTAEGKEVELPKT